MFDRQARSTLRCTPLRFVATAVMLAAYAICQPGASSAGTVDGEWRRKDQLFWDDSSQQLVRKTIRVWDSEPQQDREFYWEPDSDQSHLIGEVIEGRGTLTWRSRGAPNYDRKAVRSTYHGEMKNGRPHGYGRLVGYSGLIYEGTWVEGFWDGRGSLQLESGDLYVGEFKHGHIHGHSRYSAASGEIYDGTFVNDKREGTGTLILPTGEQRTGNWVGGQEVREQGQLYAVQGRPNSLDDIAISVTADVRKNMQIKSSGDSSILTYTQETLPGEVSILPDDKRLMSGWKFGGQMYNIKEEAASSDYSDEELYKSPAFLKVTISGAATQRLSINSLRLEVTESHSDLQPLLGVQGSLPDYLRYSEEPSGYSPAIVFVNTGWGGVANAKASISFAAQGATITSRLSEQQLGSFDRFQKLSVERELQALHVDIGQLKSWNYKCSSLENLKYCQQQMLSQLMLGELKPHVSFFDGGRHLVTYVTGTLSYEWKDNRGSIQSSRSPFKTRIVLGEIQPRQPAEASGPDLPDAGVPVLELASDRANYQLAYPLRSPLPLGENGRDFTIGVFAKQSSNHRLRVVADLSDGHAITSRIITITYMRPRQRPDDQELQTRNNASYRASERDSCDGLWMRRNSIWHQYAYCFTTEKGRQRFGNDGCSRDLNAARAAMSPADRAEVEALIAQEQRMGCR